MITTRVGIYRRFGWRPELDRGRLLFHPEFYKVAVSGCGCHDNRMDKASWNEQWMGYPVGPQYAESRRTSTMLNKLQGQAPADRRRAGLATSRPSRLTGSVDALIKADKDYRLRHGPQRQPRDGRGPTASGG